MTGKKTRFTVTPGMRRLGASVLGMEAIVVALSTPVAIMINKVEPALAVTVGIGLALGCAIVAGLLRYPWAYVAGSVVQVLAFLLGFVVPVMFVLGAIFAGLWIAAIFVAHRVETATKR